MLERQNGSRLRFIAISSVEQHGYEQYAGQRRRPH
jgi:hypothetical protein